MATNVATLTAKLKVDSSGVKTGMDKAEKQVAGFSGNAQKTLGKVGPMVAAGAATAAVAVGAFAVKSVQAFAEFEKGMNEVFTLMPGMSEDAMSQMEDDVKDFSKEMGVATDEAIPALYQAISAGVPADNVFEFMETAAMAAVGGVTDMETAVDGISSAVNAYGADVLDATTASDMMFTAVKLGKTDFGQLSASMFQVAPIASGLGVDFSNVTAALAALTAQGVPTSVASTQIKGALAEMGKEGSIAFKAFEDATGKTFPEFIAEGGNLQEAFAAMKSHADDTGTGVQNLFGSIEAGQAALALTSESGGPAFVNAMEEMAASSGATQTAFETMEGGLGRTWAKIKAQAEVGMIDVGEALAPVAARFSEFLEKMLPKMIDFVVGAFEAIAPALDSVMDAVESLAPVIDIVIEHAQNAVEEIAEMTGFVAELVGWVGKLGGASKGSKKDVGLLGKSVDVLGKASSFVNRHMNPLAMATHAFGEATKDTGRFVSDLTEEQLLLRREQHKLATATEDTMGTILDATEYGLSLEPYEEMMSGMWDWSDDVGRASGNAGDYVAEYADQIARSNGDVTETLGGSVIDWAAWETEIGQSMEDTRSTFESTSGSIVNIWDGAADELEITADEMMENLKESFAQKQEFDALFTELGNAGMFGLQQALLDGGPGAVRAIEDIASDQSQAWQAEFMLDPERAMASLTADLNAARGMFSSEGYRGGAAYAEAWIAGMGRIKIDVDPRTGVVPDWSPSGPPKDYASGGIVASPTFAHIGEGGEPEAIVPLSKADQYGFGSGSGGDVNVFVEGNLFGAATADELVDLIEEGRRQRRMQGGVLI